MRGLRGRGRPRGSRSLPGERGSRGPCTAPRGLHGRGQLAVGRGWRAARRGPQPCAGSQQRAPSSPRHAAHRSSFSLRCSQELGSEAGCERARSPLACPKRGSSQASGLTLTRGRWLCPGPRYGPWGRDRPRALPGAGRGQLRVTASTKAQSCPRCRARSISSPRSDGTGAKGRGTAMACVPLQGRVGIEHGSTTRTLKSVACTEVNGTFLLFFIVLVQGTLRFLCPAPADAEPRPPEPRGRGAGGEPAVYGELPPASRDRQYPAG